jgi:hypothetical protein
MNLIFHAPVSVENDITGISHAIWLSAMVWIHGIPAQNATLF